MVYASGFLYILKKAWWWHKAETGCPYVINNKHYIYQQYCCALTEINVYIYNYSYIISTTGCPLSKKKIGEPKLRSGVKWIGVSKQKGVKQGLGVLLNPIRCICIPRERLLKYFHQFFRPNVSSGAWIAQSVRLATGWTVRGSNPGEGGGRDFPHPSRPALRPSHSPVQRVPGFSRG